MAQLKVLVDQGFDLIEPTPSTLFCLLEFEGSRLATSHNEVRNGRVKFNEEAEFSIKKSGNLRIQLCSMEGKSGFLSLNEHKLYGRAKFPIEYTDQNRVDTIQALQLKSKSGKDRAKIKFKLTIPANPNFDSSTHASNLLAMKSQSFSTYSVAQSATPTPQKSPKVSSLFKRNRGSIRSNQSSGGDYSGSRQSLDSAGFETQGGARESSSRNSNLQNNNLNDSRNSINFEPSVEGNSKEKHYGSIDRNDSRRSSGLYDDGPSREDKNPFGSQQSDGQNNPFGSEEDVSFEPKPPARHEEVKLRQKKSKSGGLRASLGLGSHKEESNSVLEEELAKVKQENEWLNRQNRILQSSLGSKENEIKELNSYIESLLVKIMKQAPEVLQS